MLFPITFSSYFPTITGLIFRYLSLLYNDKKHINYFSRKQIGEQHKLRRQHCVLNNLRCPRDRDTWGLTRACGGHQHSALCVSLGQKLNSPSCASVLKVESQSHGISRLKSTQRSFSLTPLCDWMPSTTLLIHASSFSPWTSSCPWASHLPRKLQVKINAPGYTLDRFPTFCNNSYFHHCETYQCVSVSYMSSIDFV